MMVVLRLLVNGPYNVIYTTKVGTGEYQIRVLSLISL